MNRCGTAETTFWTVSGILLVVLIVVGAIELCRAKKSSCKADEVDIGVHTDVARSGRAATQLQPLDAHDKSTPTTDAFQPTSKPSETGVGPNKWRACQSPTALTDDTRVEWDQFFFNHDTTKTAEFEKSVPDFHKAKKAASHTGLYALDAVDRADSGCRQGCGAKVQSALSLSRNVGIRVTDALRPAIALPEVKADCDIVFNNSDALYHYAKNAGDCMKA